VEEEGEGGEGRGGLEGEGPHRRGCGIPGAFQTPGPRPCHLGPPMASLGESSLP